MMPPRTRARTFLTVAAGSLLAATLLLCAPGNGGPPKWDLSLTLRTEGVYQVIIQGETYNGVFAFTLQWTGTMEVDDDDYYLVQSEVKLLDWTAHETTASTGTTTPLMTEDFPEKPSFHHFYVLREKGLFHVDFALEGLTVPVHKTPDLVFLDLPRTAGSLVPGSQVDYDAHLRRGANILALPSSAISIKPLEKFFAWSWGRKQWSLVQEHLVFLANDHKAKAVLRIRPYKANKR